MDGTTVEHSDSDSGESWTLLENIQSTEDGALDLVKNRLLLERENVELHSEKDEDTDGISIISDSDPESSPDDVDDVNMPTEENRPAEDENTSLLAFPPQPNIDYNHESVRDDTFILGDEVRCKTYEHKQKPKLVSILDIIMIGTCVVTAGMALGHLWNCKCLCTTETSVNKILSKLYKLQEENAHLKSEVKEIIQASSYLFAQQDKTINNKLKSKQYNRCKKIFEEPVLKNEDNLVVKCINDHNHDHKHDHKHDKPEPDLPYVRKIIGTPEHEKQLLKDIKLMQTIYNRNKDPIMIKRIEDFIKWNNDLPPSKKIMDFEKKIGPIVTPDTEQSDVQNNKRTNKKKSHSQTLEKQLGPTYYEIPLNTETDKQDDDKMESNVIKSHTQINLDLQLGTNPYKNQYNPESVQSNESFEIVPEKKITYADSLKINQPSQKSLTGDMNEKPRIKDHIGKKKHKDNEPSLYINSFSEDDINDIKKDDRYAGPKVKHEKNKHDRQKSHKKQKRNNKYEQWDLKGGYLKDFDEFSVTSSQDNDVLTNKPEKIFLNPEFETYIKKLLETKCNSLKKDRPKNTKNCIEKPYKVAKASLKGDKGEKDSEWYNQRSALRAEARKKLEHELFDENMPNTAAWYFRRMQKREQCRAQKDNRILKNFSNRKMNYKMKC